MRGVGFATKGKLEAARAEATIIAELQDFKSAAKEFEVAVEIQDMLPYMEPP